MKRRVKAIGKIVGIIFSILILLTVFLALLVINQTEQSKLLTDDFKENPDPFLLIGEALYETIENPRCVYPLLTHESFLSM